MEWNRTYSIEDNENGKCFAVLEAKAGGFLAVGQVTRGAGTSFTVRMDAEGEVIWQRTYEGNRWMAVIEAGGGYILAGGSYSSFLLIKIDDNGEVIWTRQWQGGYGMYNDIVSCLEGGYTLCSNYYGWFQMMRVDSEGRERWRRFFDLNLGNVYGECYDLSRMADGGFAIVGSENQYGYGIILRTDNVGNLQWTRIDYGWMGEARWVHYRFSVVDEIGYLVVAGRGSFPREDNRYPDRLLVKFAPERSAPIILSYEHGRYKYDDQ